MVFDQFCPQNTYPYFVGSILTEALEMYKGQNNPQNFVCQKDKKNQNSKTDPTQNGEGTSVTSRGVVKTKTHQDHSAWSMLEKMHHKQQCVKCKAHLQHKHNIVPSDEAAEPRIPMPTAMKPASFATHRTQQTSTC